MNEENLREARRLIAVFEKRHFQGYVAVTFCSSSFEWGTVQFRRAMSGAAEGEIEFRTAEELVEALKGLLSR